MMLNVFSCASWLVTYFWRNIYSNSLSIKIIFNWDFVFLLLSCNNNSLCVLDTNPLSGIWLANIFSYFLWVIFFHFLDRFLSSAKGFNFSAVQFLYFVVAYACSVECKKPLSNPRSWKFTPVFSFRGFNILFPTFKSVIHFVNFCVLCEVGV